MFNDLSESSIMEQLSPIISEFRQTLIPGEVELLPNNRYSEKYAWMYSFEKRLKYKIEELLGRKLRYEQEKILFGADGVFSEGLSNSYAHGHKKNNRIPFEVWTCVARKGLGFSLKDQGDGFDYKEVLSQLQKGESFFKIAGNGFSQFYRSPHFTACYLNDGTKLCILYLF